jgi:hypothetical protein
LEATSNQELAARLREVRLDMYGEHGSQFMADALGIALGTWMNYEAAVVIPARIILQLIDAMHVRPRWLLTGEGAMYNR